MHGSAIVLTILVVSLVTLGLYGWYRDYKKRPIPWGAVKYDHAVPAAKCRMGMSKKDRLHCVETDDSATKFSCACSDGPLPVPAPPAAPAQ